MQAASVGIFTILELRAKIFRDSAIRENCPTRDLRRGGMGGRVHGRKRTESRLGQIARRGRREGRGRGEQRFARREVLLKYEREWEGNRGKGKRRLLERGRCRRGGVWEKKLIS